MHGLFAKLTLKAPLLDVPPFESPPSASKSAEAFTRNNVGNEIYEIAMRQVAAGAGRIDYIPIRGLDPAWVGRLGLPPELMQGAGVEWQVLRAAKYIPPHIDSGRKSAVNFYLRTHGETTNFHVDREGKAFFMEQMGNWFCLPEWVDTVGSFVARSGEAYLLDVSSFHSVTGLTENKERVMITVSLQQSFEEARAVLSSHGLIES
jgi:hypothetical protein